jgi:hypothetical protein
LVDRGIRGGHGFTLALRLHRVLALKFRDSCLPIGFVLGVSTLSLLESSLRGSEASLEASLSGELLGEPTGRLRRVGGPFWWWDRRGDSTKIKARDLRTLTSPRQNDPGISR